MVYKNNKFDNFQDSNEEFKFERKSQKLKFSKKCQDCGREIKSKENSSLCKSCLKDYCYN